MTISESRALFVTSGFASALVAAWLLLVPYSATALPHTLFFVALIVNTYFSIKFFSPYFAFLHQKLFDIILVFIYILLAFSIGRTLLFDIIASSLFAVAAVKYVLLNTVLRMAVVSNKIGIDFLGSGLCVASAIATASGYPTQSAWALAIIFAFANVYLLTIRPMYAVQHVSA